MAPASQPLSHPKPISLQEEQRRSANYHPSIWDPSVIKSFTTPYTVSALLEIQPSASNIFLASLVNELGKKFIIIVIDNELYGLSQTLQVIVMYFPFFYVFQYEFHGTKLEELKQETDKLFASTKDTAALLKLIDSLRRLGAAYHFQKQIAEALTQLHVDRNVSINDLSTAALYFRLLREHGYRVSAGDHYILHKFYLCQPFWFFM